MFRQRSILDYCPIGGKISEDDKIETYHNHDGKEHPDYVKTQKGGKDDVE